MTNAQQRADLRIADEHLEHSNRTTPTTHSPSPPAGPAKNSRTTSGARRSRLPAMDVLGPLAVFAAAIGVWYFFSYVGLSERKQFLLPPPHRVLTTAFLDWNRLQPMLEALWRSAVVAGVGLGIAIVFGVTTAVVMSQNRWVERSFWPYVIGLQCVPILAVTPLIGALLGFSFNARIAVTFMIALFPIISGTLFGILSVEQGQQDLMTLQRVSRFQRMRKLELPAALPSMLAGFRVSAGLAVIGSVVGDVFFRQGKPGIGALIDLYRTRLQGSEMIASVILSAILGITFFAVFGIITQLTIGKWSTSAKR